MEGNYYYYFLTYIRHHHGLYLRREFIRNLCSKKVLFSEVVMNLPASATDFLDVFIGLGNEFPSMFRIAESENGIRNIRVHVHAFSTDPIDPISDIANRSFCIHSY